MGLTELEDYLRNKSVLSPEKGQPAPKRVAKTLIGGQNSFVTLVDGA